MRYPVVTSVCYVTVRSQSKYFTKITQLSQHGINSVPKYKFLYFVNLSEQTATSLCSKERNSATTTENMRIRYCLYAASKLLLRLIIALEMTIYARIFFYIFVFNGRFVTCCINER
jgi:hypothetical protein